jgi:hypothetical protein
MIEHKPAGFVRAKMRRHGDGSVAGQAVRQQAVEARRRLFAATKEIDALMKAGIDGEALEAALKPFLEVAGLLPVRANDTA